MDGDDVGVAEQVVLAKRNRRPPPSPFPASGSGSRRSTFMPSALAMAADALAELAEAERRRASCLRGPGRWSICQGAPAFSRAFSKPMWRVSSSIRPKAMPAVGLPKPPVPQTVMPRSAAALMSKELLRAPVVISSFRSGSASITLRGKRRALAHADDDGKALQRLDRLVRRRRRAC